MEWHTTEMSVSLIGYVYFNGMMITDGHNNSAYKGLSSS